jgi:GT2 family glycosyltransferase
MDDPIIDIIVPVWNKPVETRNCLVHLIEHTPQARFILVDNGCDRETERLLEEFAEILDQRALLLRNNLNQGYVRAVNRGLARAEAPYLAIVRNTSLVTSGWLEPLLGFARERSEVGVIVPRLVSGTAGKTGKGGEPAVTPIEAGHGSFEAMLCKKQAYDAIGGMDEEMDGGLWCLKDYSRRACRAGFLTFRVAEGTVFYKDEIPFGSAERREMALQSSIARYRERWGSECSFCVYMPKGADLNILRQKLEVLRQGARQGHFFTVLTHAQLHKELMRAGCHRCHENIRFERLPLLFETGAIRRALAGANEALPGVRAVTAIDGMPFPNALEGIPFAELERLVAATQAEKYCN